MASTTSTGLRLELIADGEASNTWGSKTNTNLSMLDRAISGYVVYPVLDGNNTLSATDYLLADWHNMGWKLTGALTADAALRVPAFEKVYIVENATTGAFTVTVKTVSGTGVIVPQGQRAVLLCDGTNVVGTVMQPYSANNASIGAISTAGFLTRKANGTFVSRTIEGTDEQITVTQGLGEDSNPKLSLNTNLIAPGSLRVTTGLSVAAGGIVVSAGGLTVQAGTSRFAGPNASVQLASNSGFGSMDISGPSGAVLDLKNSESEDFDIRLLTSGTGGELISASDLNLRIPGNRTIQFIVAGEAVGAVTSGGFGAYKGLVDVAINGNSDSQIQWRNAARNFNAGVRASGGFSIRNNGQDAFIIGPGSDATFVNGLQVNTGPLAILNGGIFAQAGAINFKGATNFESRGIFDDATAQVLYLRGSQNVGILAGVPQQQLHLGNLSSQKNSVIRVETGGPLGFRSWDFGVGYGDFGFIINDATGGNRRLTIDWQTGRTILHSGLTVTGAETRLDSGLTVTGTSVLSGETRVSKAGGGTTLTVQNPTNTGGDGCQVQYNGARFNAFTRVSQGNGSFEFVNSGYTLTMFSITQGGACLNATGTYGQFSDERLKDNIRDARDYTDDLMKLRVVDYSLKADALDHPDKIGFVAQEVQEVLPELVIEAGDFQGVENALAVSTSNMMPMIVKALQEMNRRLEAVENA